MMPLKPYHYAWLSKHPERTEDWLRQRLREGFDIHHLDGDHQNNDPLNLVLIEHSDHMELHGHGLRRVLADGRKTWAIRNYTSDKAEIGRKAYEAKRFGVTWPDIDHQLGLDSGLTRGASAMNAARVYAKESGLPWPKADGGSKNGRTGLKKTAAGWVKRYGPNLPPAA